VKEDAETVTAFFEDMKRRGLNDPLLVTSDGAPGIKVGLKTQPSKGPAKTFPSLTCLMFFCRPRRFPRSLA
jgi:hypothetical protein